LLLSIADSHTQALQRPNEDKIKRRTAAGIP